MADVNAEYLKVKLDLSKRWHPKYARKRIQHVSVERIYKSLFGITWQSLVMPSNDPRDRIVYPIHKLMIDSYNLCLKMFAVMYMC